MLKIIGAVFVCLSAGTYGCCLAGELKEKAELFSEWKRCLIMLKGEIRFGNTMLPEAFLALEKRAASPFGSLFSGVRSTLYEQPSKTLSELWEEEVRLQFQKSLFSEEELE